VKAARGSILRSVAEPDRSIRFYLFHGPDDSASRALAGRLLKSLVQITRDLGAEAVAEGVETAEEAEACADIGFTRAQGFYYGIPQALAPVA
jgi:EAL domain-containing protein (putative c-di-GMP-specific phosphodiesterase class I)